MNGGAAVRVERLRRVFGRFVAVDDVTFDVAYGEIFGFLGPNGAGKTTTIKMLTGLLQPSGGAGTVAGFDILRESEAIKRGIGYMSQLFSLYGDLTVAENIAFFSGLYGVSDSKRAERRDWALSMAGLTDSKDRLTRDLPLGFKQRLALGCAVLHEPRILFLDEPTSGVDPLSRRAFWDLIRHMTAQGTTVFVSTHYMEEAEYCHRLALMNRGKLIALDTPSGLRTAMHDPILEITGTDGVKAVEVLRGTEGIIDAGFFGRAVHATVQNAESARRTIAQRLAGSGLPVGTVREIRPSLEDVFIARVRLEGGAPAD